MYEAARRDGAGKLPRDAKHVLIVEDTTDTRELLEMHLCDAEFRVTFCIDGKDALAAIERRTYDFYLIDVELPFVDGYTVTRKIFERHEDAFVVLTTAYDFQDLAPRSRIGGVAEIWLKPYSMIRLKHRISCAIGD